jgi:hypothetical protein
MGRPWPKEMKKLKEAGMSPINIKTIAEGKVAKETRVYLAVERLNNALEHLLISIASRLKHE